MSTEINIIPEIVQVVVSSTGPQGAPGPATIAVGNTTTGNPGTQAIVANSGTSENVILNFTIPRGADGYVGADGAAATVAVGSTTTGNPGTNANVTNSGSSSAAVFDFTIPRGADGDAATVSVGSTTTGSPGTQASVTNSGNTTAAVLEFTIPRGDVGATGPQGPTGAVYSHNLFSYYNFI